MDSTKPDNRKSRDGRRTVLFELGAATLGSGALASCLRAGGSGSGDDARVGSMESTPGTEEVKAAAQHFYDVLNRALETGDLSLLDQVIATDAVDHNPVPGMKQGLEGIKQAFADARASFPDMAVTVEEVLAEGDKAICRFATRGTHRGDFLGVRATGRPVAYAGIDILRIVAGKLVDRWGQIDSLALLQQIGAIPGLVP